MNRGSARRAGGYRGRSSRSGVGTSLRYVPVGAGRHSTNDALECKDGTPPNRREAPKQPSPGSISRQSEHELTLGHSYKQDRPSSGNSEGLSHMGINQHGQNPLETASSSSQPSGCSSASDSAHENHLPPLSDLSLKENTKSLQNESQIQTPIKYGINSMPFQNKGPQFEKNSLSKTIGTGNIELSGHPGVVEPFDICPVKTGTSIVLKVPLLSKNREKRRESKRAEEGPKGDVISSGMVLLKGYISSSDQVKIVKKCRELGLGSGGFYQPGYRDGGKLNLQMMCLGKNWDPETGKYEDERPVDNAKPPPIPDEFFHLVKQAIQDSQALLSKEKIEASKVEKELPWMTPDICIVNFYTTSGRLGLHQDRDEREETLRKGLPVVSFSIGDSAEFLYSNQRDVFNADKVLLESGDVLIFGGESRRIFHGVASILPNTSPQVLLKETNLRPGRLNLTFRQY